MKQPGKITFLVGSETTRLEIQDTVSGLTFLRIDLNPEQLSEILSRSYMVPCEMDIRGLERLGKKMEMKAFTFEIPNQLRNSSKTKELSTLCETLLPNGWHSDNYFGSKGTFTSKEGKDYATVTIRRWV